MAKSRAKAIRPREEIHTNPDNVRPIYANWAQLGSTENEFKLIFGEVLEISPARSVTRELARVYMSPRLGKSLLLLLYNAVERHEKQHGPIALPGAPIGKKLPS